MREKLIGRDEHLVILIPRPDTVDCGICRVQIVDWVKRLVGLIGTRERCLHIDLICIHWDSLYIL